MLRIFRLFSFLCFGLCLIGVVYAASSGGSAGRLPASVDPDRDGDNKGYTFFPMTRPATGKMVFIFDPSYRAFAVYNANGERVNVGKASGGKLYCPDVRRGCKTVVGTFQIVSKGGPGCKSSVYPKETRGGAPMPYCMRFHPKGYAVHGSNDVPYDRNASHGCVRVTPKVAAWLSKNLPVGSTVIVTPYHKTK